MDMNDGNERAAKPARRTIATLPALLATGLALAATPALSQGAMGPGGGAMTPQPRVAPPPAPVAPPPAPVVAPQMPIAAPSVNQPVPQPRSATSSSNRDHIDQDAQTDIKKLTTSGGSSTGSPGGAQKTIRVINNSETDTATVNDPSRTTTTPTGPAKPMPNYSNTPIPGIDVVVRKKPAGNAIPTAKTDGTGQATFRQLEPGTYEVALPKVPEGGTVSLTTFVNGVPASRTDFPVGSSIGTFTVAKASDTVILKFQTNLGSTPVNGVGGTGGGRLQTGTAPTNGIGGVGGGRLQTDTSTTPTNGIGGTGGGRYTFKPTQ